MRKKERDRGRSFLAVLFFFPVDVPNGYFFSRFSAFLASS